MNDNLINSLIYKMRKYNDDIIFFAKDQVYTYYTENQGNFKKVGKVLQVIVDENISENTAFKDIQKCVFSILDRPKLTDLANQILNNTKLDEKAFRWELIDTLALQFKRQIHINLHNMVRYFLILLSAISALAFFSEEQLSHVIWSQLSMTQAIQFSFIERIEYLVICGYVPIMISSMIIPLWAHTRRMRDIFHMKQKYILGISLVVSIIIPFFLTDRYSIDAFIIQISHVSLYLCILLLYIFPFYSLLCV
ncbi:GerAB/ArcD/ProY family transporter [Bacillus thuringiensis]|nr:GerAB/ArcD/ProY family transporter [Bacillus thuringiensis]